MDFFFLHFYSLLNIIKILEIYFERTICCFHTIKTANKHATDILIIIGVSSPLF